MTRTNRASGRGILGMAGACLALIAAIGCGGGGEGDGGTARSRPLVLLAAAGVKAPVEAAIAAYRDASGVEVQTSYAGSGTLLNQITVAPSGDLFLAAEQTYIDLAIERGLAVERFPIATQHPVIVVASGNPLGIRSVADLERSDVRIVLADPDAAAIGRVLRGALARDGSWDRLAARAVAMKPTVHDIVTDVGIGSADATIAWDTTAVQHEGVGVVEDPALSALAETVEVAVLASSDRATEAIRFARFMASRDRGQPLFASAGFEPVPVADAWSPHPTLMLYAGTMFNAVVEDAISAFEEREGVTVNTTYNGCGILVSQMRAGAWPDAYLSCDEVFMRDVAERFGPWTRFSENPIVIAVARGNPKGIRSLEDLLRPGVRVGIGHPTNSALGHLTARILALAGLADRLEASGNVKLDSPSGDMLVNQLRLGSLDACVCYISNVLTSERSEDELEIVRLDGVEGSLATQPYAVSRGTDFPMTLERLRLALLRREVADRFRGAGFTWVGAPEDASSEEAPAGAAPGGQG